MYLEVSYSISTTVVMLTVFGGFATALGDIWLCDESSKTRMSVVVRSS